ncbi:unnamed protein product [Eruca vesicaria subsp. sativa]|uniref:Insecticidal crystal toxin domain-containing protein n=1 Tax=Eruca vesicaria subsp. sativa TaxID=29727 RepID=A0ABC8LY72_ERUVS|nr:unnamed protein product [Eruca vesicaria subsp. sativa]
MYVTRHLSEDQRNSSYFTQSLPEGPNSGVLVIQDEESKPTCCFGSCYAGELKGLPFPQNAKLTVTFKTQNGSILDPVLFIPVPGQALFVNRYYVVKQSGKHSGGASASAKEEDRVPCCFCFSKVPEARPQEVDPYDIYQQFEIRQRRSSSGYYTATSVAPNGIPPAFLKRKYWSVGYSNSQDFGLIDDAKGINAKLRSELPKDVNTSVVVGKWYVPFIFVRDGEAKDQIQNSTYYSMSLKQRWEEVYSCDNNEEESEVVVDVEVETEVVKLGGEVTKLRATRTDVVWYGVLRDERKDKKIGLGLVVVERIKWEEERFGWLNKGDEVSSSVKRTERFEGGSSHWKSYKCYVLVESFELKRRDGSLVLTYEFRHVDKLKSKWMYVTRHLSEYQKNSSNLSQLLPEGPNSGVLVIQDEESKPTCCFGSCYDGELKGLPFPQNAKLTVTYRTGGGNNRRSYHDPVLFIPVPGQPLSLNRYYVIKRRGKHSGEATASAKEEDRVPCCFCFSYVPEAKPQEADPYDIYQQFEIRQRRSSSGYYTATSVAPNGIPPLFLKRKYWTVGYSNSHDFGLTDDAKGINAELRSELPKDVDASVVVGKWYVPFIFVKERDAKDQMKNSTYYSMTLKQRWEEVFSCDNDEASEVVVDVDVDTEVVKLGGEVTNLRETRTDGAVWFTEGQDKKIGLGSVVVERIKWEEESFGWLNKGDEVRSSIKRTERFEEGSSKWKSYKCYVLVESFELKRTDGSLVLTYEFRHVDKLKSKWV